MAKRKKPKKFDADAEVRAIARERIGVVKPSRVIVPKVERKPKHKSKHHDDPLAHPERES